MNHITIYTTLPLVGGNSTIALSLASFFIGHEYGVKVIVRQEQGTVPNQAVYTALQALGCQTEVLTRLPYDFFVIVRKILKDKKAKSSIFISLGMGYFAPVLAFAGRFKRRSFYYINHDPQVVSLKRLGPLLKVFDAIIAISPASILPIKELAGPAMQVVWLPQFSELPAGEVSPTLPRGTVTRFGFVGSLLKSKGVLELIAMWPAMKDSELHILGDGELREEVARQSAATPHVRYLGGFAASERTTVLPAFFEEIDYLLVPSLGHGEGIPTVILEALSCGVPIISTDGGGIIAFGQTPLLSDFSQAVRLVPQADFATALMATVPPTPATRQEAKASYQKWFSDEVLQEKWLGFAAALAK